MRSLDDWVAVLSFMDRSQLLRLELCCRTVRTIIAHHFGTFPRADVLLSVWLERGDGQEEAEQKSDGQQQQQCRLMASVTLLRGSGSQCRDDSDCYETRPHLGREYLRLVELFQNEEHQHCTDWTYEADRDCYVHPAHTAVDLASAEAQPATDLSIWRRSLWPLCSTRICVETSGDVERLARHVRPPFVRVHLELFAHRHAEALRSDGDEAGRNAESDRLSNHVLHLQQLFAAIHRKQQQQQGTWQICMHTFLCLLHCSGIEDLAQQKALIHDALFFTAAGGGAALCCNSLHFTHCCTERHPLRQRTLLAVEAHCAANSSCNGNDGQVRRLRFPVAGHSLQTVLRLLYTSPTEQQQRRVLELEFKNERKLLFYPLFAHLLLQHILKDFLVANDRCAFACVFELHQKYVDDLDLLCSQLEHCFDQSPRFRYFNYRGFHCSVESLLGSLFCAIVAPIWRPRFAVLSIWTSFQESADGHLQYEEYPLDYVPLRPGSVMQCLGATQDAPFLHLRNSTTNEHLRIWCLYSADRQCTMHIARYWALHRSLHAQLGRQFDAAWHSKQNWCQLIDAIGHRPLQRFAHQIESHLNTTRSGVREIEGRSAIREALHAHAMHSWLLEWRKC